MDSIKRNSIVLITCIFFCALSFAQEKPTLTMSYWPDPVVFGDPLILNWVSSNANSCKNSAGTSLSVNGSWVAPTNFIGIGSSTITCTGQGGSVTKTAGYEILPRILDMPPSLSVTHSYSSLEYGEIQTISWQSVNAIGCFNSAGSTIALNGQSQVKVYFLGEGASTISCYGSGGKVSATDKYFVTPISEVPAYKSKIDALITPSLVGFPKTYLFNNVHYANAGLMYHHWPVIDGLMSFYSISGDEIYLDLAIDIAESYVNAGVANNGYLNWYSNVGSYNNINHDHVEWRAGAAVALIVSEIYKNNLTDSYLAEVNSLSSFLENNVWKKWTDLAIDVPDMKAHTSTSVIARVGQIALALYRHTGKSEYLNYINHKGLELKNSLEYVIVPGAPEGLYNIRCKTNPADCGYGATIDVSHSSDTVSFIVDMYKSGYIFNSLDIQRLANTVKYRIWNQSSTAPIFYNLVNGTGGFVGGEYQGAWIKLAQYDDELLDIYKNWSSSNSNLVGNGSNIYNIQIWGNLVKSISINK